MVCGLSAAQLTSRLRIVRGLMKPSLTWCFPSDGTCGIVRNDALSIRRPKEAGRRWLASGYEDGRCGASGSHDRRRSAVYDAVHQTGWRPHQRNLRVQAEPLSGDREARVMGPTRRGPCRSRRWMGMQCDLERDPGATRAVAPRELHGAAMSVSTWLTPAV